MSGFKSLLEMYLKVYENCLFFPILISQILFNLVVLPALSGCFELQSFGACNDNIMLVCLQLRLH